MTRLVPGIRAYYSLIIGRCLANRQSLILHLRVLGINNYSISIVCFRWQTSTARKKPFVIIFNPHGPAPRVYSYFPRLYYVHLAGDLVALRFPAISRSKYLFDCRSVDADESAVVGTRAIGCTIRKILISSTKVHLTHWLVQVCIGYPAMTPIFVNVKTM